MVEMKNKLIIWGVFMATLMSALLGCEAVDKRATEPILTELSAKYGESFTIYALGDRFNGDTATAYVYMNDDPTLLFTARVNTAGTLLFDDYAYRNVCRKVENMVNAEFSAQGLTSECFADFWTMSNDISLDSTPLDFIGLYTPKSVAIMLIIKSDENVTGENIAQVYYRLYEQLAHIDLNTAVYILSAEDYDRVAESVRLETQAFNAYRLKVHGVVGEIIGIDIQLTDGELSETVAELATKLAKGVT